MRKVIYSISLAVFVILGLVSCKKASLKDEVHKTFLVNGISALDGQEAVRKSLEAEGFKMDGEIEDCDLSAVGMKHTLYCVYYAKNLTGAQVTRLTGGLLDNLPSGVKPYTLTEGEDGKARVYLSWYPSGEVEKAVIELGDKSTMMLEDRNEVNKRLSLMFETSKISNSSYGYRTYYDKGGAAVYYPGYYYIEIGKAEALLGGL